MAAATECGSDLAVLVLRKSRSWAERLQNLSADNSGLVRHTAGAALLKCPSRVQRLYESGPLCHRTAICHKLTHSYIYQRARVSTYTSRQWKTLTATWMCIYNLIVGLPDCLYSGLEQPFAYQITVRHKFTHSYSRKLGFVLIPQRNVRL